MSIIKLIPRQSVLPGMMDHIFGDFGLDYKEFDKVWVPVVDLSESEDAYEIHAEMPGIQKEDIKISLEGDVLILSGEKKEERKQDTKKSHRVERVYGSFCRSFRMPREVKPEGIKAKFENGILKVEIPKREEAKPKEIAIQ